jgi:hypothetical protein
MVVSLHHDTAKHNKPQAKRLYLSRIGKYAPVSVPALFSFRIIFGYRKKWESKRLVGEK